MAKVLFGFSVLKEKNLTELEILVLSGSMIKKGWAINYVAPQPPAIFYTALILMQIDSGFSAWQTGLWEYCPPPVPPWLSPAINHHSPVLRSPTVWSRLQGHRLSLTLI